MLLLLYIKVHVRSPNVQYVHILSPLSSPNVFSLYLSLSSLSIYISIFLSKLSPPTRSTHAAQQVPSCCPKLPHAALYYTIFFYI